MVSEGDFILIPPYKMPDLIVVSKSNVASDGGKDKLTAASTAITKGRLCAAAADGLIAHYVSGTNGGQLYIALEAKASGDATNNPVQLYALNKTDRYIMQVTGTPAQAHVGDRCDVASDGTLDLSATTNKDFTVDDLYDSTHVVVKWNDPIA